MAAPRGRHQDSGRARLARPLRPVAARPWRSPRNAPGGRARPRPDRRHRGDRLGSLGAVEPVEVAERRGRVHPLPVRGPRPGHGLVRPPAGAAGQRPRGQPVDRAARRGRPRGARAVRRARCCTSRAARAERPATPIVDDQRDARGDLGAPRPGLRRPARNGCLAAAGLPASRRPGARRRCRRPATWPPASRGSGAAPRCYGSAAAADDLEAVRRSPRLRPDRPVRRLLRGDAGRGLPAALPRLGPHARRSTAPRCCTVPLYERWPRSAQRAAGRRAGPLLGRARLPGGVPAPGRRGRAPGAGPGPRRSRR